MATVSANIRLDLIMIQDDNTGKFTAYFSQFPEVVADGESENETQLNLYQTLSYYFDYRSKEEEIKLPNNHVTRKSIDLNFVTA